jgi:exonuclease III
MKLISLNAWCGIKYELLKEFLEYQSKDVDIFCFQEIRNGEYLNQTEEVNERTNLFEDLKSILPDFVCYFTEMAPGVGIASFVRKNIEVEKVESKQILTAQETKHLSMPNGDSYYPRVIQSIYLKNRDLITHNFHGIPGNSKKDTPERDLQTNRLLEIINNSVKSQILVGDFNLNMNTEAIQKLENKMQNLVKDGGFKTTRNSNYNKIDFLPFADYAFVSKDIKINQFEVLPDEVSDHLALLLDFI